ncbi:MAG TPA: M56 family metallopeptidase [Solirubrobacterales bacterium]|nr:M56 family metallopeptidase [Solirubrobacterales bacterium]
MDSADRCFAFLVGTSLVFLGYGACGIVAFALAPLVAGDSGSSPVLGTVALGLLVGLAGASAAFAARAAWRHRADNARLAREVERAAVAPGAELREAAREAGLEGRVVAVASPRLFSFVFGLFRPRVAIATGMLERLSPAELRAALEHERYHVRNLDPLRELVGRMLAAALFFAPLAASLHARYATERELAADRRAAAICGRRPLAGALLAALEGAAPAPRTSVGLAGSALLASRLAQLETGRPAPGAALGARALRRSALGLAAVVALFLAAVYGVGGDAAVARLVASELAPANLLAGTAVCAAPVICLVGVAYGRLASDARRVLPPV